MNFYEELIVEDCLGPNEKEIQLLHVQIALSKHILKRTSKYMFGAKLYLGT